MKVKITIDGREFPCYYTLGAALRFKDETGRDVSAILADDLCDSAILLWCCVRSACNREGVEFDMPLMDFADNIDEEQLRGWASSLAQDLGESKKKAASRKA